MKAIPHPAYPHTTMFVPDLAREDRGAVKRAIEILVGRFDFAREPGEPAVRSLLDLAPHDGIFAAWFYSRFPYAWIDMVEGNVERQKVCTLNAPPGSRVVPKGAGTFLVEMKDAKRRIAFDAVHAKYTDLYVYADVFDFSAMKLAIIEHDETDIAGVVNMMAFDFSLVAADRRFTAWVKA